METNRNNSERRLENTVIGFKITSYQKKDRVCNVSVTIKDEHGEEKTKLFKGVYVSALLNWSLLNKEEYEVGKYYESSITSEDWKSNPLQLIKYNHTDDGTVLVKYLLATVSERPALRIKMEDPMGKEMVDVVYRHHKKENYKRWRNYAAA